MPFPFHVWVEGETQGKIAGGDGGISDIQGREDSILGQALDHSVHIPRDPQTGLPTGKRVHQPLKFTKYYDKASPLLYQALCSGEQLSNVEFKFFRISPKGMEEHYFTIKLTNAIVVDIRSWVPQCLDPAMGYLKHMEDVSFTYRRIWWTWVLDGIESEDNWQTPK
jgi:type VI secretion system secreted protein Hcp